MQDVYQKDGRVYLRYAIVNGGRTVYFPAAPDVFTLNSPRAPQSLIPLANSQLAGDLPAQVERRGTRSRCSHRVAGTRRSARPNRPRRDHVRSADRQRAGSSNGCQTSVPGGRGR